MYPIDSIKVRGGRIRCLTFSPLALLTANLDPHTNHQRDKATTDSL
jgi:hypothetical protein